MHKKVQWATNMLFTNTMEGRVHFSVRLFSYRKFHRFFLGYSQLNLTREGEAGIRDQPGIRIGLGTYIGQPLHLTLTGKTTYFRDLWEVQGEIRRTFKRIETFVQYYKLASFSEVSLGIGFYFSYSLRRKEN